MQFTVNSRHLSLVNMDSVNRRCTLIITSDVIRRAYFLKEDSYSAGFGRNESLSMEQLPHHVI